MTTAVTVSTRRPDLPVNADQWSPDIEKVAYRGFTAERVFAGLAQAVLLNPQISKCDPKSIVLAVVKSARWGLDITEGVDLVPVNKTIKVGGRDEKVLMCEAWVRYQGLKALAMRERIVRSMDEFCVYENDEYSFELGLDPWLRHRPGPVKSRGRLVAAYSVIVRPGAPKTFHQMAIDEIEKIRRTSKQWNPTKHPECPDWYAMKTVVRDYLARQPKAGTGGALAETLKADDVGEIEPGHSIRTPEQPTTADEPPAGEHRVDDQQADDDQVRLLRSIGGDPVFSDLERRSIEDTIAGGLTFTVAGEMIDHYFELRKQRKQGLA